MIVIERNENDLPQPPGLPSVDAAQIYIDFDGTLTTTDVIDQLIFKFAIDDRWKELERLWSLQAIGSAQCLREELALVRVGDSELEKFLESVVVDPGAEGLLNLLSSLRVPITVLSDGLDHFITSILGRCKIPRLDIRCNRMIRRGTSVGVEFPYSQTDCRMAAGHCKCASARATASRGRNSIYIGDGQSDWCAARNASVVFAKGALAGLMTRHGLAFYPFNTLKDVAEILRHAWIE